MPQEIELKLETTPGAARALLASPLLPGPPTVALQRSAYFDTPGQDLRAAGLSLRIRERDGRRIQTVKAGGSAAAGLFARPEWEQPVADDRPVIDDTTPVRALLGAKARDLAPAFEVHVERLIWNVERNGSAIELVLDRGEVVAAGRNAPVCEIELELKSGNPADLFEVARSIDAVAPVRPGVLGKAERGYRLLGPVARAVKAAPVDLSAEMDAATAFRQIAAACLTQFRLNEGLIERSNGESVHQARVGLRRLRTALSIFRPMLEDDVHGRLQEETRWLAMVLGPVRDLDVMILRDELDDETRAKLRQARERACDEALSALASPRARALMLDLSEWLVCGAWLTLPAGKELRAEPVRDFSAAALDRLRRKVKKGGADLAGLGDDQRHEVRKDAKKLRYAAEFFAGLFDHGQRKRRAKRFITALAALQDRLGELNDLAIEGAVLAQNGLEGGRGTETDIAGRKRALLEAAADAHDAFIDTKRFWR